MNVTTEATFSGVGWFSTCSTEPWAVECFSAPDLVAVTFSPPRHHSERRDLHAEEPGQRLQAVPNPGSAMIVGVAREGIDPAEEGPAHDPLHTVINPGLIRDP